MASGNSSGRPGSGSRSYDFGSDDVLCSYDDLGSIDGPNGNRSDSPVKDFRERRTGISPANVYSQQDGSYSKNDVVSTVDRCMKKYVDNLLNFLEGISGRLSQLEVYCYNLENSVGELRSDLLQDKKESESKLKSVEKHLQEVHRSVQILRDRQELADTQKELAKLQLVQKDSSDRVTPASDQKKCEDTPDAANQQLALALPKQAIAQSSLPARSPEPTQAYHQQIPAQLPTSSLNMQQAPPMLNQGTTFLPQQNQSVSVPPPYQHSEGQYVAQRSQSQDISGQSPPQPPQSQGQSAAFPQYLQQWPQQTSQQFPQQQQQPPPPQVQFQNQSPTVYPPYPSHQPPKATAETYLDSSPMPTTSYSMVPQTSGFRPEGTPFSYGGLGGTVQQPPPAQSVQRQTSMQPSQNLPGPQPNTSGYLNSPPYPPQSGLHGYMGYGNDVNRTPPSQSFNPGNYPSGPQTQQQAPGNMIPFQHQNAHPTRNHQYGELIEKAVGMGYPSDFVVNAIYRMEQSGQPVDFNALLDMLNSTSSAGQRGW